MKTGVVKFFHKDRGWGFIQPDPQCGSLDIFVHHRAIDGEGFKMLYENERVEYEDEDTPRGRSATRVIRLDPDGVETSPAASKFNVGERRA